MTDFNLRTEQLSFGRNANTDSARARPRGDTQQNVGASPNLDLILEAERRGILPEDKAMILNELRNRGVVPPRADQRVETTGENERVRNLKLRQMQARSRQGAEKGAAMDEFEALALATAAKKRREELRRRQVAARNKAAQGGEQTPKSFGQSLWENIVGDNDPTTQNTGEKIGTFLNKAGESMTLGLVGDEASGAVAGLVPGGRNFEERRDFERQQERLLEKTNPGAALTAEIGGAVIPAFATAGLAAGASLPATAARGAALGLGEGAIYGFSEGEESATNRAKEAARLGVVGAGVGGFAPPLMRGAQRIAGGVFDPIMSALNVGNRGRADKAMAATMREAGQSPDDLARSVSRAAQQGQPEFRTMDALGIPGQRQASGVARSGGDAAAEISEYLTQRQADQGPRVARFTDEAFGLDGRTGSQITDALRGARKKTADAAYDAASGNSAPVDVRGAVQIMDDTISKMTNSGIKPPPVVREFKTWRGRLAGQTPDGNPTTLSDYESVLANWRAVRDRVDDLYKSGQGNVAEALKPVRDALEQSLSESSDMFRNANAGYRNASRVIDALDEGRGMSRPSTRATDNVSRFQQMTPKQQGTARAGYGDEALKRLERNKSPTSNRAKEVYGSTKSRTEADAMATDPRLFGDRMGRENTMWETQNRALGGSRTADNIADQNQLQGVTGGLARSAKSLANLQFGDAMSNAAQTLSPALKGQNEATRKIIADALMSDDPMKAVGQAAIRDRKKMALQLLMEGLVRGGAVRGQAQ